MVGDCADRGGRAFAHRADVVDGSAVAALFDAAEQRFGAVDVLVNNAGILRHQMRLEDMTADRWREVFETNVIGAFVCAREAVRRMSTRFDGSGGVIVNVSSAASYLGSAGEYIDYAASKTAIDTMTIDLGKEVAADGIRVVGVRPGMTHTGIHASGGESDRVDRVAPTIPMKRGGEPDETARAILWLASDEASYITATMVNVSADARRRVREVSPGTVRAVPR